MHRRSFIAANAATLALGGMSIAGWKSALAQDATPGADAIAVIDLAPGVTAEVFFGAPSVLAPGKTVYLARFVFDAGKAIFPHTAIPAPPSSVWLRDRLAGPSSRARPTSCAARPGRTRARRRI